MSLYSPQVLHQQHGHVHQPSSPVNSASSAGHQLESLRALIDRPVTHSFTLAHKAAELHRFTAAAAAHRSLATRDAAVLFQLVVGDVFGSQAVAAGKYGLGWNLTTLSRRRNGRDFNAVLTFLGSKGGLMALVDLLALDPSVTFEYPVSRLPHMRRGNRLSPPRRTCTRRAAEGSQPGPASLHAY